MPLSFCASHLKPLAFVAMLFTLSSANADEPSAKTLFGSTSAPSQTAASIYGSYAKGCLAGGVAMPVDGNHWQAMRLSRNRNWGHPSLVSYLKKLSNDAAISANWRGLLVGDMSQPRGGPMLTGHKSHQIGLDADIWLKEMPKQRLNYKERENMSAVSVLKSGTRSIDPKVWRKEHFSLLKTAASYDEVARIFVFPAIKEQLCKIEESDNRSWLRKIRPWYGHHYHFHVRLKCPAGQEGCKNQAPPPAGDGCGKELAWWLSDEPWKPKKPQPKKPSDKPKKIWKPMTLQGLPNACAAVIYAPDGQKDLSKTAYGIDINKFDDVDLPQKRPY